MPVNQLKHTNSVKLHHSLDKSTRNGGEILISGRNISINLKLIDQSQRWLLKNLRKKGFPKLAEPTLSNIVNDLYQTEYAEDVKREAMFIIKQEAKSKGIALFSVN